MKDRVAILWNIMAILSFVFWVIHGFDAQGGIFICFTTIVYYGENILDRLIKG